MARLTPSAAINYLLFSVICSLGFGVVAIIGPQELLAQSNLLSESNSEYGGVTAPSAVAASAAIEPLRLAGRHLTAVTAKVMPAVVNIESTRDTKSGTKHETGSGVLMSSPRVPGIYVVTNRHVVADARLDQIEIYLHDARVLTPIDKLEDPASDLAVLKIDAPGLSVAQFADSDNIDIGHFVLAMGSPFGLTQSVTLGIISAKGRRSLELPGRTIVNQDFLQTDAAINPGNSGGPLIDLDGRVVGINTAIASQGGGNEGIGFSIPSNLVQFIVNQLLENGKVRRSYLGVTLDDRFDFNAARRYSLDRKMGARITSVIDSSPAALGGLKADDVVLNFDGFDVLDHNDLVNKVNVTQLNKRTRIIVLRGGQSLTLHVVLAEKAEAARGESVPTEAPSGTSPFRKNSYEKVVPAREAAGQPQLEVLSLTPALREQAGYIAGQQGVLLCRITLPASMASSASRPDLQLYDVIEEIGRIPVTSTEQFHELWKKSSEQGDVLLKVARVVGGQAQTFLIAISGEPARSLIAY